MRECYRGTVQKGTKRAAALGFPTVNITLGDASVSGIYAARVVFDDKEYPAAAFADQKRNVLEAHVLDVELDLYDKEIVVELLEKIRDDETLESDDALRAAIADDVAKVRAYFKKKI